MSLASRMVAILGGGITGLTAAFRLTQRGCRVRVFEAANRVGGVIRSGSINGWLVEAGPNSLLGGDPSVEQLIDDVGLATQRVNANAAAKNRFIVRRGRLVAAPVSPPALLGSNLFSLPAKFRIFAEVLRRPQNRSNDVSLAEFVRSHFGQELVDYALNPFVSGVYAGDPGRLSARHAFPKLWSAESTHGSLLRGQIASTKARRGKPRSAILSFRRGLQALPDAIAARLPPETIRLNATVEQLERTPDARWRIGGSGVAADDDVFDAVLVALPARPLAELHTSAVPAATAPSVVAPPGQRTSKLVTPPPNTCTNESSER